jgi:hypothetical protein
MLAVDLATVAAEESVPYGIVEVLSRVDLESTEREAGLRRLPAAADPAAAIDKNPVNGVGREILPAPPGTEKEPAATDGALESGGESLHPPLDPASEIAEADEEGQTCVQIVGLSE